MSGRSKVQEKSKVGLCTKVGGKEMIEDEMFGWHH